MRTFVHYCRLLAGIVLFGFASCDNTAAPASKINRANFDQIHEGMSQAQVQAVLGPATSTSTEDKLIYKRTTWRYTQGDKYINITFKNDELDSKDTNLGTS
jgi:hypothetical protein